MYDIKLVKCLRIASGGTAFAITGHQFLPSIVVSTVDPQ